MKKLTTEQKLRRIIRREIKLYEAKNDYGKMLMQAKSLIMRVSDGIADPTDKRDLDKIVDEIELIYTNSTEISI